MADDIILPRSSAELRERFLRDIRLAAADAGIDAPTTPNTDWYFLGEASANLALTGLYNLQNSSDAQSVLTATGDDLKEIRDALVLPEVPASGSSGKIVPYISGSTTIVDASVFILPNGLRAKVVGTYVNPTDGDEISVQAIDVGESTNLAAGEIVRFVNPPVNVGVEAKVSTSVPLSGGSDVETDERLRERILNEYRNKPAGGNWGYYRKLVLDNHGDVQNCFVYPALGGPSTQKIVPVADFVPDENVFTRSVSLATLQAIRNTIFAKAPIGIQTVVQGTEDVQVDTTLTIAIPASSQSGGNGAGWVNSTPWPKLESGDGGKVTITSVGSLTITISALTAVTPVAAQTMVAWWSSADRLFYTALVLSSTGGTGAWVLALDRPLVGKAGQPPVVGDYISPVAANLVKYGVSWVNYFRTLGPGENTSTTGIAPRALRRPFVSVEAPSSVTTTALTRMTNANPEITNASYGYQSTSAPAVSDTVDLEPKILVPRRFAVYPL